MIVGDSLAFKDRRSGALTLAALLLSAALATAHPAYSQGAGVTFDVAEGPLSAALVQFALQAGQSISTAGAKACAPRGRAVHGRMGVDQGLTQLLAGTGCTFRHIDSRAVEIIPLPPAKVAPAPVKRAPPAPPVEPDAARLDDVVVVATRRSAQAARLAYPVSVEDKTFLDSQGVVDAGGLAATSPAMTVTNLGAGRDKVILRGLSDGPLTGRSQATTGIYLDGLRLTYNAPDPDLRLVDMSRVEVLRGPQGALYGAGSLGGVIYLATAQPDPSRLSAWASATGGVTRDGAGSNLVEAMANLPLLNHRAALRIVGYREQIGGYIDDPVLNLENVNRVVRSGMRLSGRLDLSPRWQVTASVAAQYSSAADSQYVQATLGPFTRNNRVREPSDNDIGASRVTIHGGLDWGDFTLTSGLVRHEVTSRFDASATPPIALPAGPAAFDQEERINGVVTEAIVTSPASSRIQWLAGGLVAQSRQQTTYGVTRLTPVPVSALDGVRRDDLSESAVFGQASLPLPAHLEMTVGGRLFSNRTTVASLTHQGAAQASFAGATTSRGFAPKLELAFRPSDVTTFYVQAAEGYRGAGFNTIGPVSQVFSTGAAEPTRAFQGDELWNFEAGARLTRLEGRLHLQVAVFDQQWTRVQSDQLMPSGLPFTANIGDARNQGIEGEVSYRTGALQVHGSILLEAPELRKANPAFSAPGDLALALAPDVLLNSEVSYGWRLPRDHRFELAGRVSYVGHSSLTFFSAASLPMGDYVTTRLAGTLTSGRRQVSLVIDNLADAKGNTFAYGNPFTVRTVSQSTPLRPRTVSLKVSASY